MTSQSYAKPKLAFKIKSLLINPDFQTIVGHYLPSLTITKGNYENHHIPLGDGDELLLKIDSPKHKKNKNCIALLIHGMTGSSESKYVIRIARKLKKMGITPARLNLRGAGDGKNLAQKTYNANSHDDIIKTLEYIHNLYPNHKIFIAGFSLGGALTLKMLSNHSRAKELNLERAVAVCPPVDLVNGIKYLDHDNKRWSHFFAKHLIKDIKPRVCANTIKRLGEKPLLSHVDTVYTAPRAGFQSPLEYYKEASCLHEIENINIDTKIISSLDDPIIDPRPILNIKNHKHVDVHTTKYGGHLGFLIPHKKGLRYMDHIICEYFREG